jgi:hypothetical protein
VGDLAALTDDLAALVGGAAGDRRPVTVEPLRGPVTGGASVGPPALTFPDADPLGFTATWTVRLYGIPSDQAFGDLLDVAETLIVAMNADPACVFTVTDAAADLSAVPAGDAPAYTLTVSAPLRLTTT